MKFLKKILGFLGISNDTDYIKNYLYLSNARSGLYLSCVIIFIELYIFVSSFVSQQAAHFFSEQWFKNHGFTYIILLAIHISLLIYSSVCIKNQRTYRLTGRIIYTFVALGSSFFGLYITYYSYLQNEQILPFITILVLVFCFLLWHPWFSILTITTVFVAFYRLCERVKPLDFITNVNLIITWLVLLMAAINLFWQKFSEAKKSERLHKSNAILEKLSISDEVTGIYNMNYFRSKVLAEILDRKNDVQKYIFLFLDIEHFKYYNEKFGFLEGNAFLKQIANCIETEFPDFTVAYFSNDNFVLFGKDDNTQKKLEKIRSEIIRRGGGINMSLKVGAYRPKDRDCLPIVACDHARYACYSIKKHYDLDYCEYDSSMDRVFHRKQYIINNIDSAIANGNIKVYYQPIVNAKSGQIASLEALARWDDPEYGFLTPDLFITTLEEYYQIHKLDMAVLSQVCRDFNDMLKINKPVVPVSINFSRLDFELLDLSHEVEATLAEYEIDKKFIHVEITESAISESDIKLREAMSRFRSIGCELWLDDFGSGYSGLNVLKEYDFDVMKIDMKFLQNFSGNSRARSILKSMITLANEIGMRTLTEGVETAEAKDFLKEAECENLQGYLFGKPMPREELAEKIKSGIYVLDKNYLCYKEKQNEL